jgi:hypothetical protein
MVSLLNVSRFIRANASTPLEKGGESGSHCPIQPSGVSFSSLACSEYLVSEGSRQYGVKQQNFQAHSLSEYGSDLREN